MKTELLHIKNKNNIFYNNFFSLAHSLPLPYNFHVPLINLLSHKKKKIMCVFMYVNKGEFKMQIFEIKLKSYDFFGKKK
jgi:hypothetical protein